MEEELILIDFLTKIKDNNSDEETNYLNLLRTFYVDRKYHLNLDDPFVQRENPILGIYDKVFHPIIRKEYAIKKAYLEKEKQRLIDSGENISNEIKKLARSNQLKSIIKEERQRLIEKRKNIKEDIGKLNKKIEDNTFEMHKKINDAYYFFGNAYVIEPKSPNKFKSITEFLLVWVDLLHKGIIKPKKSKLADPKKGNPLGIQSCNTKSTVTKSDRILIKSDVGYLSLDAFIIGGVVEVKVAKDIVKLEGNTLTLNNNIKEVKEPILLNRTRLSIIPFDNKYFIKVPLFKSRDTHKDYPIPMRSLRYFKHGTLRCKDINTGEDIDFDLNGFSIQITPEPKLGYVKAVITQNKSKVKIIKSERLEFYNFSAETNASRPTRIIHSTNTPIGDDNGEEFNDNIKTNEEQEPYEEFSTEEKERLNWFRDFIALDESNVLKKRCINNNPEHNHYILVTEWWLRKEYGERSGDTNRVRSFIEICNDWGLTEKQQQNTISKEYNNDPTRGVMKYLVKTQIKFGLFDDDLLDTQKILPDIQKYIQKEKEDEYPKYPKYLTVQGQLDTYPKNVKPRTRMIPENWKVCHLSFLSNLILPVYKKTVNNHQEIETNVHRKIAQIADEHSIPFSILVDFWEQTCLPDLVKLAIMLRKVKEL